jgi:hypothetical protein
MSLPQFSSHFLRAQELDNRPDMTAERFRRMSVADDHELFLAWSPSLANVGHRRGDGEDERGTLDRSAESAFERTGGVKLASKQADDDPRPARWRPAAWRYYDPGM